MKTQTIITSFALVLFLALSFYSCKNPSSESKKANDKTEMATKAFEAEFIGNYTYFGPDTIQAPHCTDSLPYRIIVDCMGTSNVMGDIEVHFDFCANEQGYYGNQSSYMVDKSKDTLFISCEGRVIGGKMDEHPSFVTEYWIDDFELLGGTGKYAGARGEGKTDDYNSSEDPNSHHHWKGSITLMKEI